MRMFLQSISALSPAIAKKAAAAAAAAAAATAQEATSRTRIQVMAALVFLYAVAPLNIVAHPRCWLVPTHIAVDHAQAVKCT
jgi:hypothetical protein